jgi:hypothetical protein
MLIKCHGADSVSVANQAAELLVEDSPRMPMRQVNTRERLMMDYVVRELTDGEHRIT